MTQDERVELMRSARISKALITLTIPAIIGLLVTAVYNLVDTLFIGFLNDIASIAASAIMFPIMLLVNGVGSTFGMGSASVISRRLGEKNEQEAKKTSATGFYTTLLIGLFFVIVGNIFLEKLLSLFGASSTVMPRAIEYGRLIISGSIFQILNIYMNNMLRSEGAAKYSSIALATGSICNVILDPILMFVFHMGIAGAALATVISQIISFIYLITFYFSGKGLLSIKPALFKPSFKLYGAIMAIGLPTLFRQVLSSIGTGIFNNAAAVYGDSAVAAMGISSKILMFVLTILFGIGQGMQPLAGFNYGAKQYDRVLQSVKLAVIWSVTICAVITVIIIPTANSIVSAFSKDPDVLFIAAKALRIMFATLVLTGIQNTLSTFYQALGKGFQALFLSMVRQGIFFLPAVLLLPKFFGLSGILISQPVADIFAVFVTGIMALNEIKKLKELNKLQLQENSSNYLSL